MPRSESRPRRTILPERGERTLGKVYNDEWMRRHQFLGDGDDVANIVPQYDDIDTYLNSDVTIVGDTTGAGIDTLNWVRQ